MSWIDLLKTVPLYVAALAAVVWLTVQETELNESPIVRLKQVSRIHGETKGQCSLSLCSQGTFRGVLDQSSKFESFKGIRYALSPEKEGRFRRPKGVWEGPLPDRLDPHNRTTSDARADASYYGPSCTQFVPPAFMAYRPPAPMGITQQVVSEDCLSE